MVISNTTITKGIKAMKTAPDLPTRHETGDEGRTTSRDTGHIGRVVAGSLLSGLAAAIAIVAGPFAGAKEHVITGSVLVTFALAWAMLALLSQRWTNQPQRWAIAPAAFMAVTGAGILVLAPTGNQLGWIWPPVVITLTIWMIVHARRALRSRTRVWLVYPVFARRPTRPATRCRVG
jgi:peptidoglycan/LPS O-acetylase OafA/YrhL